MSIVDDLAKEIRHEIDVLKEGEFGEVLIGQQMFSGVSIEEYLHPEPDVLVEGEASLERANLLGYYIPMKSPGRIYLSRNNLKGFFWSIILTIRNNIQYITKFDLLAGFQLVTLKTYNHELFHFNCDVLRACFGGSYDALPEEALAVAWARMKIIQERQKWQTQIGRMNAASFQLMMRHAFNYTSDGYKDWHLFADEMLFKNELMRYIQPTNYDNLLSSGVDVGDMIYGLLGNIKNGFVDKII